MVCRRRRAAARPRPATCSCGCSRRPTSSPSPWAAPAAWRASSLRCAGPRPSTSALHFQPRLVFCPEETFRLRGYEPPRSFVFCLPTSDRSAGASVAHVGKRVGVRVSSACPRQASVTKCSGSLYLGDIRRELVNFFWSIAPYSPASAIAWCHMDAPNARCDHGA